jgi:hypothetical protein
MRRWHHDEEMYTFQLCGQLAVVAGWGDGNCWAEEMTVVAEEMLLWG